MLAFFDNSIVTAICRSIAPQRSGRIRRMLAGAILTTSQIGPCECGGIPRPPGAVPLKQA
jgi:hypothetical protein